MVPVADMPYYTVTYLSEALNLLRFHTCMDTRKASIFNSKKRTMHKHTTHAADTKHNGLFKPFQPEESTHKFSANFETQ